MISPAQTAPRLPDRYTVTENRDGLGFSNGISQSDDGEYVSIRDYDALHAENAALRNERDEWKEASAKHHPNPADHRYWEGRYRDEKAENAALRKRVEAAQSMAEMLHECGIELDTIHPGSGMATTVRETLAAYRATVQP